MKKNLYKMIELLTGTWALLIYGGLAALASVVLVAWSAHKKSNYDTEQNQEYIQKVVDSSVSKTISEMNQKFGSVLDKMENDADKTVSKIGEQGKLIIDSLGKDTEKANTQLNLLLKQINESNERLKLEKPIFLVRSFKIDKKFLPEDAIGISTPVKTREYLINFFTSLDYEMTIYRPTSEKDIHSGEIVAKYGLRGDDLKFDNIFFKKNYTDNSLTLIHSDYYLGDGEIIEYFSTLKLQNILIGGFNSILPNDYIRLTIKKRDIGNLEDQEIYNLKRFSILTESNFLVDSYEKKLEIIGLNQASLDMGHYERSGEEIYKIIK
tara:strand:- start:1118 stop:2086 length:969 start_codon:yes stop_codon:yes gene_type:complete